MSSTVTGVLVLSTLGKQLTMVCIALVGLPIMMSEIMIGRAAQKQPVEAFRTLRGGRSAWAGVGWLGVLTGFVILSYYAVVAGWALDYTLKSVVNFTAPIHDSRHRIAAWSMTVSFKASGNCWRMPRAAEPRCTLAERRTSASDSSNQPS